MIIYTNVPVVGWAAGLQYYTIDNTIGVKNFMNFQIDHANERANMINKGYWGIVSLYPGFGRSIR